MTQLFLPPPKESEEQVIDRLVDTLQKAFVTYKHEHSKESVLAIVLIAKEMQVWGYKMLIDPHKKVVGALNTRLLRTLQGQSGNSPVCRIISTDGRS